METSSLSERPRNRGEFTPTARSIEPVRAPLAEPPVPAPVGKRRLRIILAAAAALILAIAAVGYWLHARNFESTDDAFIDGDAVTISPKVSGEVVGAHILDNQWVHKGDLLIEIDPRDYAATLANVDAALQSAIAKEAEARTNLELTKLTSAATITQAKAGVDLATANVAQAQANVTAQEAELARTQGDAERYQQLARTSFASTQQRDTAVAAARTAAAKLDADRQAVGVARAQEASAQGQLDQANTAPQQIAVQEANLQAAEANVAAAKASVEAARLNLSYTKIYAPQDGYIARRSVNAGDVVQKDQSLGQIVIGRPWVTANFKETQLTRMAAGQPVEMVVDAYPGRTLKGHVDSVQRGTGAHFSLLPPENATGNYVKVVQRVPVKIVIDEIPDAKSMVLGLGMSVVPTVRINAAVAPPSSAPSS